MNRDEALALLAQQHSFPGPFEFRVVVRPPVRSTVVSAMVVAAGAAARLESVGERPSKHGKYVALAVTLHVEAAERVLDVWEILKSVDGVVTSL